jgi:hypothetical protein
MVVARRKREPERGSLDEIMAPDGSRREGWQDWARANAWRLLDVLLESRRRRREWYLTNPGANQ